MRYLTAFHYGALTFAALPIAFIRVISTVYIVDRLGADPAVAGAYTIAATILGIVVTFIASKGYIDELNPVSVMGASLLLNCTTCLTLLLAQTSLLWLIPSVICDGCAQLLMPSLFMFDERFNRNRTDHASVYSVRLLISGVWIVAPPVGFYLYSSFGFLTLTVCICLCALGSMAAAQTLAKINHGLTKAARFSSIRPGSAKNGETDGGSRDRNISKFIFLVMVVITSVNVLHAMSFPLYLLQGINAAPVMPGVGNGIAAVSEVIVLYALGRLSTPRTENTILFVAIFGGGLYFSLYHLQPTAFVLVLLQILYGAHFAASSAVGLAIINRHRKAGVGSAASLFFNASKLGSVLGSLLFGTFATKFGYFHLLANVSLVLLALAFALLILARKLSKI